MSQITSKHFLLIHLSDLGRHLVVYRGARPNKLKHRTMVAVLRNLVRIPRCGALLVLPMRLLSRSTMLYQAESLVKLPHPKVTAKDYKPPVTIDRELPDPFKEKKRNRWYFIAYGIGVVASLAIIFNYEKTRSPITNSILYFLRRLKIARDELGSGIDFTLSWPWISGELNTVKGNIDILFDVKGANGPGTIKLKCNRSLKLVPFDVEHFVLVKDGKLYDLTKDPEVDFDI